MRRPLRALLIVVLVLFTAAGVTALRPADHDAWRADYAQLREAVASSYANLEFSRDQGLDLARLDAETLGAIDGARTERGARQAMERFVAAFHDPHFRVASEPPALVRLVSEKLSGRRGTGAPPTGATGAAAACRALGYGGGIGDGYSLPFEAVPGYRASPAGGGLYHPGIVETGGHRVGVLRIALFDQRRAGPECEGAWPGLALPAATPCDDGCEERLRTEVKRRAAARLRETVVELARAGAERVLVDVGGNGGGSEWVSQATAAVAPAPLTWPRTLVAGDDRGPRCAWADVVAARCRNGVEARADDVADPAPAPLPVPVFVLIDGGTASAAEFFAAVLRDNDAVRLVGSRTMGAGCGYRGGKGDLVLAHSGMHLRVPNCARLRRDGRNERSGVSPDIPLGGDGSAVERAADALRLVAGAPSK